jgi:ribosomal protein S18 acetylase RimI-like enzyme
VKFRIRAEIRPEFRFVRHSKAHILVGGICRSKCTVTAFLNSPAWLPTIESPAPVVRRFVMQVDLREAALPGASLPLRFGWGAWRPERSLAHAAVLYEGFRNSDDAGFLRALSTLEGCFDLITATTNHRHFVSQATWLGVALMANGEEVPVSTIQVLGGNGRVARIQNIAVIPEFRGCGLGRATLVRSLRSCRSLGYDIVELEVTAENEPAVELYRSFGFTVRRSYLHEIDS